MPEVADLQVVVLARELVAAGREDDFRVLAITSPESLVAGLVARRIGAVDLAMAIGFGVLDAVAPEPALTRGEAALGTRDAHVSPSSDTFVAVGRGLVGVCTTPAQLDARGAVNLSGVGGEPGRPAVALPGSRGLPDNNDMAGPVWYVLPAHTSRTLVEAVDFVSGVPPGPGRRRRLLTPFGLFALDDGTWSAVSLHPGITAGDVMAATAFGIAGLEAAPTTRGPTTDELAALAAVDPHGLRHLPHLDHEARAQVVAKVRRAEQATDEPGALAPVGRRDDA